MSIDLNKTILADFDRAMAGTQNEGHRANIRTYREHMRCEATGQIDELVTYLSDDAEYHALGPGVPVHLYGKEAIREHYKSLAPTTSLNRGSSI